MKMVWNCFCDMYFPVNIWKLTGLFRERKLLFFQIASLGDRSLVWKKKKKRKNGVNQKWSVRMLMVYSRLQFFSTSSAQNVSDPSRSIFLPWMFSLARPSAMVRKPELDWAGPTIHVLPLSRVACWLINVWVLAQFQINFLLSQRQASFAQ